MNKPISKRFSTLAIALLFLVTSIWVPPICQLGALDLITQTYENKPIGKITLILENLPRGETFNQERVLAKLRTKRADPFSQLSFDHDLKTLSEEYDRVEPLITTSKGEVLITIKLWQKPMIRAINWSGNNKIKTGTLQKELGIKAHTLFNREAFNEGFTKVKEYYIKKGYFESDLEYKISSFSSGNEIDIQITVHEGHSGHISKIDFSGLTKKEERGIINLISTKKYNFFTSWITGSGTYYEEALEHDKLVIVNFLQNQGFANARANIQVKENENGRLEIEIHAVKGELFSFGQITIKGNEYLTHEAIEQALLIHEGDTFSPESLRETIQSIKDLYGKDGYIETTPHYTLHLLSAQPIYNVEIQIEEKEQIRIGLIRILGNISTNKNVLLRESLLIPGEVFDSRLLKVTQQRLEAMGYFKSVNVYTVKTSQDQDLGDNYRDVIIEVEETTTASGSLFFGLSSASDLFGGLELVENNFNHRGLTSWWREGLSSLRGAGEYAQARVQFGKKQQVYTLAWMDPYFRDSLWRFGFDLTHSLSSLQSDNYHVKSTGGSLFTSYPLTNYWTFGLKYRIRNAIVHIHKIRTEEAQRERQNSGLVMGVGTSLSFDSTDNAFKPHQGLRSVMEAEIAEVKRRSRHHPSAFPFLRLGYLNAYYYPLWRKGTLKLRCDLKFIYPFGEGSSDYLPLSERFFLGGETTVRGYKPYHIGPKFKAKTSGGHSYTPKGGISSTLASVEYLQTLFPMLDLFVFFDGGSISSNQFDIPNFKMSSGLGTRIELSNRIPIILGLGFPINPKSKEDVHKFFFSMGGQF